MVERMFVQICNMGLTGSFVIMAVLCLRLLLKRAPKIFSYCLWSAVLFRLLCPVSFTAFFSPFSMLQDSFAASGEWGFLSEAENLAWHVQPDTPDFRAEEDMRKHAQAGDMQPKTIAPGDARQSRMEELIRVAAFIWLFGMAALILLNIANLIKLKRHLKTATWEEGNIYLAQEIASPFVMGVFRPRIYLPMHLGVAEKEYVLLHEQIHLKRKDHLVKLAGYLALCLHWLNPLVWIAFSLSEKDMEMSCDEAVIRKLGTDVKKEYSGSLLSMASMASVAAGKSRISGSPLAFGEGDTGGRIKNVLHYKKPAGLAVKIAALLCGAAVIFLLANPDVDAEAEGATSAPGFEDAEAGTQLSDRGTKPDLALYEMNIKHMVRDERVIDAYVPPLEFPFEKGEPLIFADDCKFFVNEGMAQIDYKEVPYEFFASLVEKGGNYRPKPCLLGFEDGQIVHAALESAWDHYGIFPQSYISLNTNLYDSVIESGGERAFYRRFRLATSETADIADSEGDETVEVYVEKGRNANHGVVLFKDANGKTLCTQDAGTSRAGWTNTYLGSSGEGDFILTVYVEDRLDNLGYGYQVFRLDKEGVPMLGMASEFYARLGRGSDLVYDDAIFQRWVTPLEGYLKDSHLILSSQDGEIRTEKISEADKYNYHTLGLENRALELSAAYGGMVCFEGSWYGVENMQKETVEWVSWYNSLSRPEQMAVNYIPDELYEAKYTLGAATRDAE